ncbi:MAG: TetR family transcriptional regulator [Candidatus Binatia bacterium]|nr:MAG: TetR family transcriptional regulator [Candidatus Binatia bacterium]
MQRTPRRFRPRKRPRQERSRRTVEAILQAAARVFSARGYAGTSTNLIAEEAGVSVGSLYQYFPSKDAILLALAERHMEETFGAVLRRVREKRHAPVPELLRALVDALLDAHRVDPALHRVLFEGAHPDALFRRRLLELHDRGVDVARELIEERSSELAVEHPEIASVLVVQVLQGIAQALTLRQSELLEKPEFRSELVRLLENYLLGPRASAAPPAEPPAVTVRRRRVGAV